MRQKKSKLIYYVILAFILAGLFFIATQQVPLRTEHVSEPVENAFLAK